VALIVIAFLLLKDMPRIVKAISSRLKKAPRCIHYLRKRIKKKYPREVMKNFAYPVPAMDLVAP
jgi:hypothetical protein